MTRPLVWCVAGVLGAVLLLGRVVFGATYFGVPSEAQTQGTWHVKSFDVNGFNTINEG